jgi:hypothetical protein
MPRYSVPGWGRSIPVAGRILYADSDGYFTSVDDATDAALSQVGQRIWTDVIPPVSGGGLGTFASTGALETAFPAAANTGKTAMVGSAAPYAQYVSNGTAWVASSGGASSWSGLSDKATANLPVENAPLAAALAAASSGGNTTGYQVLNGMAKPVSLSQFFDAAVNRQARILLTGTSIAGFDWSAVKILAQRLHLSPCRWGSLNN